MSTRIIAIGGDTMVELSGLYDEYNEAYVNDATVTFDLLDGSTAISEDISMSYVSGSNGQYRGIIPAATSTNLVEHKWYQLDITGIKDTGTYREKREAQAKRIEDE